MDDNSIMPFGKHKGEKLANVPADYLIWLHDQGTLRGELAEYIKLNLFFLQLEVKRLGKKY